MIQRLIDRLRDLTAYLENSYAVENIDETIKHLATVANNAMIHSRVRAQQCTIHLFESKDPPNLLVFLHTATPLNENARKREIWQASQRILEFITEFIEQYGTHTSLGTNHIIEIMKTCQSLARTHDSNRVKIQAIEVIMATIKHAKHALSVHVVEPREYTEKLMQDLKFSKATQTSKGAMLELIGCLASAYSDETQPLVDPLILWIEEALEKQLVSTKPELALTEGLILCLANLLRLDPKRYETQPEKRANLYKLLETIFKTTLDGSFSRFQVTRAALYFLKKHSEIFQNEIGSAGYAWLNYMKYCALSDTKTIYEHAFQSANSVISVLNQYLLIEKDDVRKKMLNKIFKDLLPILSSTNSTADELRFTFLCLGQISGAGQMYLGENGIRKIEDRIKAIGERWLVLSETEIAQRWKLYGAFLKCIVKFIELSKEDISSEYITFLGDLLCRLMEAYPRCRLKYKENIRHPIIDLFNALANQAALYILADRFIYHSLLLTTSHIVPDEGNDNALVLYHPETGKIESRLVYEYEGFWLALFEEKTYFKGKHVNESSNNMQTKNNIFDLLFNAIMGHTIQILKQLDLSYYYDLNNVEKADSITIYRPNNVRDHSIMLNFTEFIKRFVPRVAHVRLERWIIIVIEFVRESCCLLPFVSGFYHIGKVFLDVADSLNYFNSCHEKESITNRFYLKHITFLENLCKQQANFKDELLLASASFILSTPTNLLPQSNNTPSKPSIALIIPALTVCLEIGKTYVIAAQYAVATLEKWQAQCPQELMNHVECIIPLLATYVSEEHVVQIESRRSDNQEALDTIADFKKLQRRILTFLGKSGNKVFANLSQPPSTPKIASFQGMISKSNACFSLMLQDVEVHFELSQLVIHLGSLATTTTDRSIKSNASEAFHAFVSYLTGKTATLPHERGTKSDFFDLWNQVFPIVLNLAADSNKISQTLFQQQYFQLIRWFSNESENFPHEFFCLVDQLMHTLTVGASSNARDVAASGIAICLHSLAQQAKSAVEKSNLDLILQRLFSVCRHPGISQRIGASSALYQLLVSLNQHRDGAQIYGIALSCMRNLLYSLRLCERDDVDIPTETSKTNISEDMISRTIFCLEQAITHGSHLFKKSPTDANTNLVDDSDRIDLSLETFTSWLFHQVAARESAYRTMCRRLFLKFAVLSGQDCREWIKKFCSLNGVNALHDIFAPIDLLTICLPAMTTTIDVNELQDTIRWMKLITSSIDSYIWCLGILGPTFGSVFLNPAAFSISKPIKRKLEDAIETDAIMKDKETLDTHSDQLTVSYAVRIFLKWDFTEFSSLKYDVSMFAHGEKIEDLYKFGFGSICRLFSTFNDLSLSNTYPDADSIPDIFMLPCDRNIQLYLSKRIIALLSTNNDNRLRDETPSTWIEQYCTDIQQKSSPENMAQQLMQDSELELQRIEVLIVKSAENLHNKACLAEMNDIMGFCRFFQKANELSLLPPQDAQKYCDTYATVAKIILKENEASPMHHRVAAVALKAAASGGWNILQIFDKSLAWRGCLPIRQRVIRVLSEPNVWKHVSAKLCALIDFNPNKVLLLNEIVNLICSSHLQSIAEQADVDKFAISFLPIFTTLSGMLSNCEELTAQFQRQIISVLRQIMGIFSRGTKKLLTNLRCGRISDIASTITTLIQKRSIDATIKHDLLDLLAVLISTFCCLTECNEEDQISPRAIIDALIVFTVQDFPIQSSDVKIGTRDYNIFRLLFIKVLHIIECSSSIGYLEVLYSSMKESSNHLFFYFMNKSMLRFSKQLAQKCNTQQKNPNFTSEGIILANAQQPVHDLIVIFLDHKIDISVKKFIFERVYVPLMEYHDNSALAALFISELPEHIVHESFSNRRSVVCSLTSLVSSSVDTYNEEDEHQLFSTIIAYATIEMLFRLLDLDEIRTNINKNFLGHSNGQGREFAMLICKCASKFVTKSFVNFSAIVRLTCAQAYNCLLAAVSKTQKQEKLYDQILFQPSIWCNIIDPQWEYPLLAETNQFEHMQLSRYSNPMIAKYALQTEQFEKESSSALDFFEGSSLSVTQSQDSKVTGLPFTESLNEVGENMGDFVELDSINSHPCMVSLIRVIQKMSYDFGDNWKNLPGWMHKLILVISDSININLPTRMFIAKLVLNLPQVFLPFADQWIPHILEVFIEATNLSSGPREFNYMLRDCCSLILDKWNLAAEHIETISGVASRFVNILIELCPYYMSKVVFQDNLNLVVRLILRFNNGIVVDTALLSDLFLKDESDVRLEEANKVTALQLISTLISRGNLNMFNHSLGSLDEATMVDGIILALNHPRSAIYTLAAEVAGLYLNSLPESEKQNLTKRLEESILSAYNNEDFGRFLTLLRNLALHESMIVDSTIIHRLGFVLPKSLLTDKWATLAVEILELSLKNCKSTEVARNLYSFFRPLLARFMKHRVTTVQLVTLQIVNSLLQVLQVDDLEYILKCEKDKGVGLIDNYITHNDSRCRSMLFEIAKNLFNTTSSDIHSKTLSITALQNLAKQCLLRGLSDSDRHIRDKIFTFWNDPNSASCSHLPSKVELRMYELFNTLYSAETADTWALHATNILLNVIEEQPVMLDALLFDAPLTSTPYHEMNLDTKLIEEDITLTPLFSMEAERFETIASQQHSQSLLSTNVVVDDPSSGSLVGYTTNVPSRNATAQSKLLTCTLTQEADYNTKITGSTIRDSHIRRRFTKPKKTSSSIYSDYAKKEMGAVKDKVYFKNFHDLRRRTQASLQSRQKHAMLAAVDIHRKYRSGEFPDIQISLNDIVNPLVHLCRSHAPTSIIVFSELFNAIVTLQIKNDDKDYIEKICAAVSQTLLSSKESATFVETIHRAYYNVITKNIGIKDSQLSHLIVSARALGESSLASRNYYTGELIIEELLNELASDRNSIISHYEDHLYKILMELQRTNYLVTLANNPNSVHDYQEALHFRISGDLTSAISQYQSAERVLHNNTASSKEILYINDSDETTELERRRCYWERLNCLQTLNQWDKLQEAIEETGLSDPSTLWLQDAPYLEHGLGFFIRSALGSSTIISSNAHQSAIDKDIPIGRQSPLIQLQQFVTSAQLDKKKWDILTRHFAPELCSINILNGNTNELRVVVETFLSTFVSQWKTTSPFAYPTRVTLLNSLSAVVQFEELADILQSQMQNKLNSKENCGSHNAQLVSFVSKWASKSMQPLSNKSDVSMAVWSRFFMVQRIICNYLITKSTLSKNAHKDIRLCEANLMLDYAGVGVSNDILVIGSKYLKEYRDLCVNEGYQRVSLNMIDVYVNHVIKVAERERRKRSSDTLTSFNQAKRYYQAATKLFDHADVFELMESLSPDDRGALGLLEAETFAKSSLFHIKGSLGNETDVNEIFARSVDVFQHCFTINGGNHSSMNGCRRSFIQFLADLLSDEAQSRLDKTQLHWTKFMTIENCVALFQENVVNGMRYGDRECSTYFPQVCEAIAIYPSVVDEFETKLLDPAFPIWTCLRWTAQLVALLNSKKIGLTLLKVLERIAQSFPVALFYDFKVAFSDRSNSHYDTSRLNALLANPVMEKFVDALRLIHHPELRWKEGLRDILKILENSSSASSQTDVELRFNHLWIDIFSLDRTKTVGSKIGVYNREWIKKVKPAMEKIFNVKPGGSKFNVTVKTITSARSWILNNFNVIPGKFGLSKDMKSSLNDFAQWLDEFDPSKCRLELPGQYGNHWGKPEVSRHITILSFNGVLGVLPSKQLPKRLTLHCSDEENYTFLVKGGEDLRLDQRIEQLFGVMNHLLMSHPSSRDRGSQSLLIKTYQVIPMTQDIGLIEWLHDTSTIKGIIERQLVSDTRCASLSSNKRQPLQLFNTNPAKLYENYLMKQRGSTLCSKVIYPSNDSVRDNFHKVQSMIPGDLLRKQFMSHGGDIESFFSLRDEFGASIAAFNVSSYILGIGDRHLDNFLLDHSTGRVIGIDFGVSFGAGASVLPVPELIPFRFTRQMEQVFSPYDGAHLVIQDMQIVFDVFRDKKQVIESVMNVFLHEPLLDWQQSTTTQSKELFTFSGLSESGRENTQEIDDFAMDIDEIAGNDTTIDTNRKKAPQKKSSTNEVESYNSPNVWMPDVKIAIARRKLDGYSPRMLLKEELAQNSHLKQHLTAFQLLVDTAGKRDNTQIDSSNSSVLNSIDQAQELLDIATAPTILGRTYYGWMPWL